MEDFLLSNGVARQLYHGTASKQPIIHYHCHLSPKDLAENRQFENVHEPWLGGDHYKIARDAGKRRAGTAGLPATKRPRAKNFRPGRRPFPIPCANPSFHWTHLELQRYFGIEKLLEESTAQEIWE